MAHLKLRWARFFTLANWDWKLSARPAFDFEVTFPCDHSECNGSHTLSVRVCEKTYAALQRKHEDLYDINLMYTEPHPALFGNGPNNTHWQMPHGSGGGCDTVSGWVGDAQQLWEEAAHD